MTRAGSEQELPCMDQMVLCSILTSYVLMFLTFGESPSSSFGVIMYTDRQTDSITE